jgi:LysR family transcriptional activator of nhaA
MEWLNYHHLLYFWEAVRQGGVTAASKRLQLAQPTISAQIRALENQLGEKLFRRVGRRLELTEMGEVVFRYAEEIFGLGQELMDAVRGRPIGRPARLVIGIADVVPTLLAFRVLKPALALAEPVRIVCREGKPEQLLGELVTHHLDVVLTDSPIGGAAHVRAFNHLLGECGVTFVAAPRLAARYRHGFPRSLEGAPMLLPTDNTALRRSLEQWFSTEQIRPVVAGEFEDSALMKAFGQHGMGVLPTPETVEAEICRQYSVRVVGRLQDVRERFYAISIERKIRHPAVTAIADAARAMMLHQ